MKSDVRRDATFRRRLTLSHDGRPFLDRWGLVHERFGGFLLHHIADADPGKDLHDHPWAFTSIVLRGGYTEEVADTRVASAMATVADMYPDSCTPGAPRSWRRFSIHHMPLTTAHRITAAEPGTWTLVLRGPTRRRWGFYLPTHWIVWTSYPYETRRPSSIDRDIRPGARLS